MNSKGQINLGTILVVFITVLVGAIFVQSIAQEVGNTNNLVTLENTTIGTLGAEGETIYITDYKYIGSPVIYNATGDLVPAANYTLTNNVVYNGAEAISITTAAVNAYANDSVNISGSAQPLTYIPDSGGRAMASLIVIMFALAVAIVALTPTLRSEILSYMGK